MKIDLQNDPDIPTGRALMEHMIGAHMVADDEQELLHMIGIAASDLGTGDAGYAMRVLMHAAYRGQELVVALLDLATRQSLDIDPPNPDAPIDHDTRRRRRIEIWSEIRDLGRWVP